MYKIGEHAKNWGTCTKLGNMCKIGEHVQNWVTYKIGEHVQNWGTCTKYVCASEMLADTQ